MKKTLLFATFLLHTVCVFAQDYQLINSDRITHFLNENSEIHSIRIDSNFVLGEDTFFYNHKILREELDPNGCGFILSDSTWMGAEIILRNNGNYIFFNEENDSILINSLAFLNDKWILYKFENGDFVEATLTEVYAQEIFGLEDSIKVLSLQAKNNLGVDITHLMNGKKYLFLKIME